jgi:LmbE family N-acetylglucosaminyl deacetylase
MAAVRSASALSALCEVPRRLLAVFAHPDDESYGCAGALARAGADPETAAVLFCMTRGEASSMGPARGLSPEAVGDLREQRLERVAEILHLDGLIVGRGPDGRLAQQPLPALAAPLREILEAFRPQVVITGDPRGVNAHPDHIAVHWAVRHALAESGDVRLAMLAYTEETCEAAQPRLMFATRAADIGASLTLSPSEIEAKEACLQVHEALVTLRADGPEGLIQRPPVEHYAFLGTSFAERAADLFASLSV